MTVQYAEEGVQQLIYDAMFNAPPCRHWAMSIPCLGCLSKIASDALSSAGRLVPPGSEVREEFGVRFKRSDDGKTDDRAARDRDDALTWIAELERVRELDKAPHGWAWTIAHAPLRRLRIVTPWSPSVPDTEESANA